VEFLIAVALVGAAVWVAHNVRSFKAKDTPAAAGGRRHTIRSGSRGSEQAAAIWAQARADHWSERMRSRRERAAGRQPLHRRLPAPSQNGRYQAADDEVPDGWPLDRVTAAAGPADELAPRRSRRRTQNAPRQGAPEPTTPAGAPPTDPGRNPDMSSSAPAGHSADLFTAVNQILARAQSGGLQAKQRAVKQLTEAHEYLSQAMNQFAQHMSEPQQGYGPEIWEPLAQVSAHDKAAASKAAESDAAITTLANMQVGELAGSQMRAPHQTELNTDG
jgi:hypothetical protein